ncbi:hypothetical protein J4214_04380 [Candidatus Woesearchaeota archaeon]|nr:hypothetical protein [Candidatus Woesearchaeota archaeon]
MLLLLDILEKKIKKEYAFIALFLLGSLLFFDLVGIDYSGITGAQVGGDIDIGGISKTFENLYNLIFQGFLAPVFSSVGGNSVIAIRILVALIIFAVISFSLRRSERFGRMGNIIAIVIGLLTATFIPQTILDRFFGTSGVVGGLLGVFVGVALIAILFYFNYKWEPEGRIGNIFKGLGFILMVFIIIYFAQQYGASELGNSALINIFNIVYAVSMLVCVILGFYYLFYRGFVGAATAVTEAGGLGPAGVEQARRAGRFFYNRGGANQGNNQQQGRNQQQNPNLRQQIENNFRTAEADYLRLYNEIQRNGNNPIGVNAGQLSQSLQNVSRQFAVITNDTNQIQDQNRQAIMLFNLRAIVTTLNNAARIVNPRNTYNVVAQSLNRGGNSVQGRLRNIQTQIQGI